MHKYAEKKPLEKDRNPLKRPLEKDRNPLKRHPLTKPLEKG